MENQTPPETGNDWQASPDEPRPDFVYRSALPPKLSAVEGDPDDAPDPLVEDAAGNADKAIRAILFRFPQFARRYLIEGTKSAPIWFVLMWLMGITSTMDRIELRSLRPGGYQVHGWTEYWGMVMVGGLLAGLLGYYVQGFFYYLRVKWSGGRGVFGSAANVSMYSGLPVFLTVIATTVAEMFIYGGNYFTKNSNGTLDMVVMVLVLAAVTWSITLSYRAARKALATQRVRSIIFFILLPAVFYLGIFGGIAALSYFHADEFLKLNTTGLEELQRGNYRIAIRSFEEAFEKTTKTDEANRGIILQNLALTYGRMGDNPNAIAQYQRSLQYLKPQSVDYYQTEALIALHQNKVRDALVTLGKVLKMDPDNFMAHNYLALVHLGDYDEGFADYEKALHYAERGYQLNPVPVMGYLSGRALFRLERYPEAITRFEEYLREFPEDADGHAFLGLCLYKAGRKQEAIAPWEKCLRLDEDYREGYIAELLAEITGGGE